MGGQESKIRLSFIVPIYNGEDYLEQCLNSLLAQDISFGEYEIVCVDDCSKDNSKEIVKAYQRRYSNIILLEHSINKLASTACNTALKVVRGEYIWFVGQDDLIESNCLRSLLDICFENSLDVLPFNYKRIDEENSILDSNIVFENSPVMDGDSFIHKYFHSNFCFYLLGYEWRALFRKSFLDERKVFLKDGIVFEDTIYFLKAILFSSNIMSLDKELYKYRVNSNSVTQKFNNIISGFHIYEYAFVAGNEVEEFATDIKERDAYISDVLINKASWYYNSFVLKLIKTSIKEKCYFYELVRNNNLLVDGKRTYLSRFSCIVLIPVVGLLITVFLKPIYLLKKKLQG